MAGKTAGKNPNIPYTNRTDLATLPFMLLSVTLF